MSESKEEILANFQSITGIDDIGEAFSHLEDTNWDLMTAVHRVIPQDDDIPTLVDTEPITPGLSSLPNPLNGCNSNTFGTLNNFSAIGNRETNSFPTVWPSNISYSSASNSAAASTSTAAAAAVAASSTATENTNIIDLTQDMDLDDASSLYVGSVKQIVFNIHYNQQIYTIRLPANATVEILKQKIRDATFVPTCRQDLRGWPPAKLHEAQKRTTVLSSLGLSAENELILINLAEEGCLDVEKDEGANNNDKTFILTIVEQPSGKQLVLNMPGRATVEEVKMDVYHIRDIPVRHQEWTGWPQDVTSQTTLADSGIELSHNFILVNVADKQKNTSKATTTSSNERENNTTNNDSDSSDEFEDASDFNACEEYFTDSPPVQNVANRHLIPDNIDGEILGSITFGENYRQHFGEPYPNFYSGSLEDAIKDACLKPARERKLLAIYLHHGESISTNVFCDHLMKHESILQTLAQSYVLYGWDLTYESNKQLFLSSVTGSFGSTASMTVRNMPLDQLPAIMLIGRSRVLGRTTCEVISVISGNVILDTLLSRLIEAVEMYNEHLQVEIREEDERAARDQVKAEQDMAYQETLEADMAKEAAKQQQREAIAAERHRLDTERAEEEARREAIRAVAEEALPAEPDATDKDISKIRVRKPTGEYIERMFYQQNTIEDVMNFVTARGFLIEDHKLILGWPRRDLTSLDPTLTLHSLKLHPQETLILEER